MDNQPTPLTELELNAIAARAAAATPGPWRNHDTHLGQYGYAATVLSGKGNDTDLRAWLPSMSQKPWDEARNVWADAAFVAAAREDVPALLAEIARLNALAADATEYRVHVPENGGTTLLLRRQAAIHGMRWAVSTMARGGGHAWTTEGWQEAISAISVDRLFCWPDPATAIDEARQALTRRADEQPS